MSRPPRVLVTRAREDAGRLVAALETAGLDVRVCPLVQTEPLEGPPIDAAGHDWLVFTSRAGVRHGLGRVVGALPPIAAIGPGTAEAVHAAGARVALIPAEHTQAGLVSELAGAARSVLFLGAEQAGELLREKLDALHVAVYRTVELRPTSVPDAEIAVLASGSAASALAQRRTDIPVVTIGPTTSREARRLGLHVLAEATSSDLEGLLEAVTVQASRLRPSRS